MKAVVSNMFYVSVILSAFAAMALITITASLLISLKSLEVYITYVWQPETEQVQHAN